MTYNKSLMLIVVIALSIILVACGGATPEPTNTPIPPTATPEPSPTVAEVATEEATEVLTTLVAPNPTAVQSGNTPQEAVIAANVDEADVSAGEQLYTQSLVPACVICHVQDSTVRAQGPSLVGFSDVAGTRIEGQGAYTYAYNSIRYSNDHIVDGYQSGVMPVYDGILTDQEVYELIAYIWTLQETE